VDLYKEAAALKLIDAGEFHRLVNKLISQFRISVGTLAHYGERRGVTLGAIFGESQSGRSAEDSPQLVPPRPNPKSHEVKNQLMPK